MCGWEETVPDLTLESLGLISIAREKKKKRVAVHQGEKIG